MNRYLLVYDRPAGRIIASAEYRSSAEALRARFDAERTYRHNPDVEVVVLGAESWEALRTTHGRYFFSLGELAQRMSALIERTGG